MSDNEPFSGISEEPLYNIKAVSRATGIEAVTLRAWERRYGIPSPNRTEGGYRLYSERDVAILQWLKAKVDAGMTIGRAVAMLHSRAPQAGPAAPAAPPPAEAIHLEPAVGNLLAAAHAFDSSAAHQIMTRAFALYPLEDVCLNLLVPALRLIGEQWRTGEASLQVEHFLTNLVRQQLLALDASMPPPYRQGRIVVGCAPDDWHEMGVLMLTLFLRRRGWDVIYLGQAVGLNRLADVLSVIRPGGVLLSASSFRTVGHLPDAAAVVAQSGGGSTWFAFGGTLFPIFPQLVSHIPGIYVGDTLGDAIIYLDGLLAGGIAPEPQRPPRLPEPLAQTFQAVRLASAPLIEHLAGRLRDANPDLSAGEADDIAGEVLAELLAALRFEMPEMLEPPEEIGGPGLAAHGLSSSDLMDLFGVELEARHLDVLEPYLARL